MSSSEFTRLVLSGGELKGLSQLGALHSYWEAGAISHETLTHYAGSSVGSLICLLMVCGYTPYEIWEEIHEIDSLFWAQPPTSPLAYFKDHGFMSVDGVMGKINELILRKFNKIPSMMDLHKRTGKTLVVTVTNFTLRQVEYCSYKLTPNLSCLDAVQASCNIPGIFKKIRWNKHVYMDGSIMDNFPLLQIDDGKCRLLGISTGGPRKAPYSDENLVEYVAGTVLMPIGEVTRRIMNDAGTNCSILELAADSVSPLEFVVHLNKRRALFLSGYKAANEIKTDRFLQVVGYVPPCVFDQMHRL